MSTLSFNFIPEVNEFSNKRQGLDVCKMALTNFIQRWRFQGTAGKCTSHELFRIAASELLVLGYKMDKHNHLSKHIEMPEWRGKMFGVFGNTHFKSDGEGIPNTKRSERRDGRIAQREAMT